MVTFSERVEASFICIIYTYAFQTLMCVRNPLGENVKMGVLIQSVWVGPEILHF